MELDEALFTEIDLNALFILLVVYRERGVTRAAQRLNVKQPAVSNTLAKLRIHFQDPLFIRHSRGLTPTPKANEIMRGLAPALMKIQEVLRA
ncbi:HTH-type transcriptional regulator LeuO [Pseudomonas ogarae]|uniref:LysR family transcriptional regulator n=1 Tax=Pseudomonas ogarae (strain DSM 112162 / CECT 30235 / F113) TaxID=1114970 RepID=UPI000BB3326F|nr:LysR family transcriptional regulator [Pseudomonas ogarae]PBJ16479.1 HTH-type transcriptional regulator LeuO [Pseudomonas ogarae]